MSEQRETTGPTLSELSAAAVNGPWYFTGNDRVKSSSETWPEGDPYDVLGTDDDLDIVSAQHHVDAHFIVAVVNAYREGRLVERTVTTPDAVAEGGQR